MIFDDAMMAHINDAFPYAHHDPWGMQRVFLDNGTGTMILKRSADAQYEASLNYSSCLGGIYRESRVVDEYLDEGFRAVADLFNAESPDTIIMGQTATSLLFQVSYALGHECTPKHNIVTTYYEHLANVNPWLELVRSGKAGEVRFAHLREDGTLDIDHLRSLIDENTKVVSISAASNLLGSKSPLKEIGEIAHEVGAFYVVDGVHHAAHGSIDVQDIGCDFCVVSAYKFFCPKFISVLYGRQELLENLMPYSAGKDHDHVRGKWQWGSPDHAKTAALTATINYLAGLGDRVSDQFDSQFTGCDGRVRSLKMGLTAIEQYEKELSKAMIHGIDTVSGLIDMPNVTLHGIYDSNRLDERDPTFAFSFNTISNRDAAKRFVEDYKIAIRSILYWSKAEDFFKIEYPIRASLVHYNTLDEVRMFLEAVKDMSEA